MNINLKLSIPFKGTDETLTLVADTLLEPFYITEREVLSVFLEEYSDRFVKGAREIIFYSSIKANEILELKHFDIEELKTIRRQLTLCLAIIGFGNKFNSDFIKSMSRSKTLADFTVSTTVANDSGFLNNIIKDAQTCVNDLTSLIQEINSGDSVARLFVKGQLNTVNYDSNRLWAHRDLPSFSTETHASLKKPFNGRYYKNGGNYVTKS